MRPVLLGLVSLTGCDIIRNQIDGNQPPVIDVFEVDPAEGAAPLLVGFSWSVADVEGDTLTCTINFGDGQSAEVLKCSQVTDGFHEYVEAGGYVAVLTANDRTNAVSQSIAVRANEAELPAVKRPAFRVDSLAWSLRSY